MWILCETVRELAQAGGAVRRLEQILYELRNSRLPDQEL